MRDRKPGKVKMSKQGNVYVGKSSKSFPFFLDVFQNGSIYKVKGTKETFNYLFKYIYKIQRRVLS